MCHFDIQTALPQAIHGWHKSLLVVAGRVVAVGNDQEFELQSLEAVKTDIRNCVVNWSIHQAIDGLYLLQILALLGRDLTAILEVSILNVRIESDAFPRIQGKADRQRRNMMGIVSVPNMSLVRKCSSPET